MNCVSPKCVVSFKYDPFGRRIYKSSSSGTGIFAYDDDGNLIEETNSSGAAVARFSQGLNIDEPLAMLRSGVTSYYQADALGSVTSLSKAAGSLVQSYTFDSFGKQTASSGSVANPFQYTARAFDPETSLYYYRARYYDPTVGRFLSEDPTGLHGGDFNLYRFVGNNPVLAKDPSGHRVAAVVDTLLCIAAGVVDTYVAFQNYFTQLQNLANLQANHNAAESNAVNVCGSGGAGCDAAIDLAAQTFINLQNQAQNTIGASLVLPGTFTGGPPAVDAPSVTIQSIQNRIIEREMEEALKAKKKKACNASK
jgi:RHS repeat-associated protein